MPTTEVVNYIEKVRNDLASSLYNHEQKINSILNKHKKGLKNRPNPCNSHSKVVPFHLDLNQPNELNSSHVFKENNNVPPTTPISKHRSLLLHAKKTSRRMNNKEVDQEDLVAFEAREKRLQFFSKWVRFIIASRRKKAAKRKAYSKFVSILLYKSFEGIYCHALRRKRLAMKFNNVRKRTRLLLLNKFKRIWEHSFQLNVITEKVEKLNRLSSTKHFFVIWRIGNSLRERERRYYHSKKNKSLVATFNCLLLYSSQARYRKKLSNMAENFHLQHVLRFWLGLTKSNSSLYKKLFSFTKQKERNTTSKHFKNWCAYIVHIRAKGKAVSIFRRSLSKKVFKNMSIFCHLRKKHNEYNVMATLLLNQHLAKRYFHNWIMHISGVRNLVRIAEHAYKISLCRLVFLMTRRINYMNKQRHMQMVRLKIKRCIQNIFITTKARIRQKRIHQRINEMHETCMKKFWWRNWRGMFSEVLIQREMIRYYNNKLMSKLFNAWANFRLLVLFQRCRKISLLGLSFQFIFQRSIKKLKIFALKAKTLRQKEAFGKQEYFRKAKSRVVKMWILFSQYRRRHNEMMNKQALFHHYLVLNKTISCFQLWKKNSKLLVVSNFEKLDRFQRRLAQNSLQKCFSWWLQYLQERQLINLSADKLVIYQRENHLRQVINLWKCGIHDEQKKKKHAAAVARCIVSRSFIRWRNCLYLLVERKVEADEKFISLMEDLCFVVFDSWHQTITKKKKLKKLEKYYKKISIKQTKLKLLRYWSELLYSYKERMDRVHMMHTRSTHRLISTIFLQWKAIVLKNIKILIMIRDLQTRRLYVTIKCFFNQWIKYWGWNCKHKRYSDLIQCNAGQYKKKVFLRKWILRYKEKSTMELSIKLLQRKNERTTVSNAFRALKEFTDEIKLIRQYTSFQYFQKWRKHWKQHVIDSSNFLKAIEYSFTHLLFHHFSLWKRFLTIKKQCNYRFHSAESFYKNLVSKKLVRRLKDNLLNREKLHLAKYFFLKTTFQRWLSLVCMNEKKKMLYSKSTELQLKNAKTYAIRKWFSKYLHASMEKRSKENAIDFFAQNQARKVFKCFMAYKRLKISRYRQKYFSQAHYVKTLCRHVVTAWNLLLFKERRLMYSKYLLECQQNVIILKKFMRIWLIGFSIKTKLKHSLSFARKVSLKHCLKRWQKAVNFIKTIELFRGCYRINVYQQSFLEWRKFCKENIDFVRLISMVGKRKSMIRVLYAWKKFTEDKVCRCTKVWEVQSKNEKLLLQRVFSCWLRCFTISTTIAFREIHRINCLRSICFTTWKRKVKVKSFVLSRNTSLCRTMFSRLYRFLTRSQDVKDFYLSKNWRVLRHYFCQWHARAMKKRQFISLLHQTHEKLKKKVFLQWKFLSKPGTIYGKETRIVLGKENSAYIETIILMNDLRRSTQLLQTVVNSWKMFIMLREGGLKKWFSTHQFVLSSMKAQVYPWFIKLLTKLCFNKWKVFLIRKHRKKLSYWKSLEYWYQMQMSKCFYAWAHCSQFKPSRKLK